MLIKGSFEVFDGSQIFKGGRREFWVDDSGNARLVLDSCLRGRGGRKLFEAHLPVDLVNSE